jgi:hypothetical protein
VSAFVQDQDAVRAGELRDLVPPVTDVAGVAVNQDQRLAGVAMQFVVQVDAADGRERLVAFTSSRMADVG